MDERAQLPLEELGRDLTERFSATRRIDARGKQPSCGLVSGSGAFDGYIRITDQRQVILATLESIAVAPVSATFADADRANRWLREPLGELSRTAPLDWARTEAGARLVEEILAKIDWGAAA